MANTARRDLDQIEPIERASRDELAALQLKRLKRLLRHAYEHVPLYRARFDDAEVHPSDLRRLEDLARFPFTTKSDLRDNYPFGMLAVPARASFARARFIGHNGTADRRRLHGRRCPDVVSASRALDASRRRAAW